MNESKNEDEIDRRLRKVYRDLRDTEREKAPAFAPFWSRAERRARGGGRARRRNAWMVGALSAATALLLMLLFVEPSDRRHDEPMDYEPSSSAPAVDAAELASLRLAKPEPLAFLDEFGMSQKTPSALLQLDRARWDAFPWGDPLRFDASAASGGRR